MTFSTFCLIGSFPYSSNLYFLWVYIDIFLVVLFFTIESDERKMELIALSSRILICAIFGMAILQKVFLPSFMNASFYYQAFSSEFFGFQFAPFAERFLFAEGLTTHVINSNREVMVSMAPNITVGSTVPVSIYQSSLLLKIAQFMVWSTLLIELFPNSGDGRLSSSNNDRGGLTDGITDPR